MSSVYCAIKLIGQQISLSFLIKLFTNYFRFREVLWFSDKKNTYNVNVLSEIVIELSVEILVKLMHYCVHNFPSYIYI